MNYVDPDKKPDLARMAGIRNYGTVVIHNGQRTQEAKSVTEEEITGALIRTLKTGEHMACFVTGSGELTADDSDRNGIATFPEVSARIAAGSGSSVIVDSSRPGRIRRVMRQVPDRYTTG